ncbi:unnamed protein product [Prunus armeniaca]
MSAPKRGPPRFKGKFRGGSCQLGIRALGTMSTRRPRTRGRGQRWGPNPPPPSPSPPPSPPIPSPPPSPPAGDNALDLRQVLSQFTRTMTTALRGRRSTESFEIKRVKELRAKEFMGGPDPAEAESWISDVETIFEVLECPDGDRVRLATFLHKGKSCTQTECSENVMFK